MSKKFRITFAHDSFAYFPSSRKHFGTYVIAGARAESFLHNAQFRTAQISLTADFPFTLNAVNVGMGHSISVKHNKYFGEVAVLRMAVHDVLLGESIEHVHGVRFSFGIIF